jgi:hypothetical protein
MFDEERSDYSTELLEVMLGQKMILRVHQRQELPCQALTA